MTSFNTTVLMVASVLLIVGLIIIGMFIVKSLGEETFPPVVSDCPDYWDVISNPNGEKICRNNAQINDGLATCRAYPVNLYSVNGSSDNDKLCDKNKWAKGCNIHWDGITNNPKACENARV